MRNFTLASILILFISPVALSQDNFWSPVDEAGAGKDLFANSRRPASFKLFQLDLSQFRQAMIAAPHESNVRVSQSAFVISVPNANGQLETFRIVEAPVMHPALAAKYPGVTAYAGRGVSDPSLTIRFDLSPIGMHAVIHSPANPSVYIDPLDGNIYRVVSRAEAKDIHSEFKCLTEDLGPTTTAGALRPTNADDGKLRVFRLAMISAGEFSQHWLDGTEADDAARKVKVVIAQNSHMTRANAVFERDFGIRLQLVANNDQLIFLTPGTDPFPNPNSPSGTTVQNTNDNIIGSANYDIGHLESKGSDNGNAGCIGCVCTANQKGRGWTVYSNPSLLEFFVIDYLTHEMGHQLGANHTFTFSNEGTIAQVEPGSGSSIMGYAGITGSTDVQPHSDEFFHSRSIEQVTNYLKSAAASCAEETLTGNAAPVANAGADYIIPRSTPFKLTGSATDADALDLLTYGWEQIDQRASGFSTFPSATATAGPQFRAWLPTVLPSRTIPQLTSILSGTNGNQWEALPSVARTLNFRFIVRDNHPGAGNNSSDDMILTVSGTTGPFGVSAPNTALTWDGGTTQNVTWTVNGTDGAPINCSQVNILLSTDGGITFPITLAANTPNDGSEPVVVPNMPGNTNRVKVEAVGNIFFDISNTNFVINAPVAGFDFSTPPSTSVVCASATTAVATLDAIYTGGYTTPVTLSASNVPAGATVSFSVNPLTPGTNSTTVTLSNANLLATGTYTVTITGTSGTITRTRNIVFTINPGAGPAISLQPASQSVCAGSDATFTVSSAAGLSYQWQVSTPGGGSFTPIAGATSASLTVSNVTTALHNNQYRVVVTGPCGPTVSSAAVLTVLTAPAISAQPQSVTLCLGSDNTFAVTAGGSSLTYQWQVSTDGGGNFSNIAGATTSSLAVTNITTTMSANQYRVIVGGACAPAATSNAAVLTVISPVAITSQPDDVTICETGNVTFSVAGSGAGVLYQWQVSTNGGASFQNIAAANAATLNVNAVTAAMNNNQYRALLSNPTCTAPTASDPAVLTVNARPTVTITADPAVLLPGQSTTINASINPSAAGFDITWYRDGIMIPGITGTSYVVDSVEIGAYRVDIINQLTGCNNQSNLLSITTTPSERLFIFPSPNNGQFTVSYFNSAGTASQRSVTVYDARGGKKYNGKFTVNGPYTLLNINLRPAAAGVYVIVIGDATGKRLTEGKVMVY